MFNEVNEAEYQGLKDAVAWITILIAGADGKIDTDELDWATKLSNIRSYSYSEELKEFYASVGQQFEDDIKKLIDELPQETANRTEVLTQKLSSLNPILLKMENSVAYKLYESYISFAEHVAKASGGFFRFASVSKEEQNLMILDMLDPIELKIEEEEDFDLES